MQGNHASSVTCVAVSPDGTRVASGGNTTSNAASVMVRDARTGALLTELVGHTGGVRAMAFSPDGTRLVSGDSYGTVIVWDVRGGLRRSQLPGGGAAFSPDGSRIATIDRVSRIM